MNLMTGTISMRRRDWRLLAAAPMVMLAASAYLFMFEPTNTALMPQCPLHALTGLHCPGCGTLRALHALLHGDVARAFSFNPLMMLALPVLIPAMVLSMLRRSIGGSLRPRTIHAIWITLMLYGVLRNLPWWPFTLLAPS